MTKSKYDKIVRTEARTGVIGSLKKLVDDMNSFEDSIGQVSAEETTRRLKQIKSDADTLLENVRSEQDVQNIQSELDEFADNLPKNCPHPPERPPDDAAIIAYTDIFIEFQKTYGKKKKIILPPRPVK